ncbi:Predicted nucleotidyltransferase [Phaffia rhodozyma]|uniref:Predicted nucleotidyltransferase n=1 Tax=Phaffia rhodozyma TaxID=264483 RepID=A0A0F7SID5_PHARH|nr:Predicted nucleotidyltransferase [Phaffia rhodozyma]
MMVGSKAKAEETAEIQSPSVYLHSVRQASLQTTKALTIYFTGPLFSSSSNLKLDPSIQWDTLQSFLGKIYGEAVRTAQSLGRVLWDIDVLFEGLGEVSTLPDTTQVGSKRAESSEKQTSWDVLFRVENDDQPVPPQIPINPSSTQIITLPFSSLSLSATPESQSTTSTDCSTTFPVVALGGSFDHLHAGHKILLTMAALITSRKLIVGVSDDPLLTKKAYANQLEPLSLRLALVHRFLRRVNPKLDYDVVPIGDVYGPTAVDADIQALVLSWETVAGGKAVDDKRAERGLPGLKTFIIGVLSHTTDEDLGEGIGEEDGKKMKEAKMSSTFIREWIEHHPDESDSA